ncbi:MAG: serine/threonine protein kinase, partial [Frankia sp.]|nr:serine/threonine protein kinase [Frankia sp.]
MPIIDRDRIAAALPGYILGRELGSGAFGLVLAARRREPSIDVAIKVLDPGISPHAADTGTAADASPAIGGADQPLTNLIHPHLSRVYEILPAQRPWLVVSQLVPGGSLDRQSLSQPVACAVALAVADGLIYAHAAGILHRGITPANILFTVDGRPKLTDLGVVTLAEQLGLTAGRIVGSAGYLAPEQILGGRLGPPTDIYALAATLYELLAGAPLFGEGRTAPDLFRHHCEVIPPPPPGVPAPLARVLARALAKQPGDRHQLAIEFADDLAEAARLSYGPDWLAAAGVPLSVSPALRERASGPPAEAGEQADTTHRLPPGAPLA